MSTNPLHALIERLEQYIRAVWRCHHASTNEEMDQTVQAWVTLTTPFWKTYRIPSEAIRGLADSALAWCCETGFGSAERTATVEQAVHFITELAMLTVPCAMPSVYSNPEEAQKRWEGEGRFLIAALASQDALRRLAALTGNEWKGHGRLPWDPPLEDGSNHRMLDESTSQAQHNAQATKRKRSTERGEARVKIIAGLTEHHQYVDGSCLNTEPIGVNELARTAQVSPASVSTFFKDEFQGHDKYRGLCLDVTRLVGSLKLLRGEYSPHHLYGSTPPGEGSQDGE